MTDTTDKPDDTVSGDVIGAPDTSGAWLAPAAAATRLGVSERTLWRHVTAGRYHKRTVAGRAEILVPGELSALPVNRDTDTALAAPDTAPRADPAILAVVDELRRQYDVTVSRLSERDAAIAQRDARIIELERENAMLKERRTTWRERVRRWWQGD